MDGDEALELGAELEDGAELELVELPDDEEPPEEDELDGDEVLDLGAELKDGAELELVELPDDEELPEEDELDGDEVLELGAELKDGAELGLALVALLDEEELPDETELDGKVTELGAVLEEVDETGLGLFISTEEGGAVSVLGSWGGVCTGLDGAVVSNTDGFSDGLGCGAEVADIPE